MNEEAGHEDFIELKDLFGPEDGNSSFSCNTNMKSMTFDENFELEIMGFDPEAMIRDIANDVNNVNASVSSDPAVIRPSFSLVLGVVRKGKSEVSTSSSSKSSGEGTSAKHSGNGTSYKRAKSKSARRMAMLGNCCRLHAHVVSCTYYFNKSIYISYCWTIPKFFYSFPENAFKVTI